MKLKLDDDIIVKVDFGDYDTQEVDHIIDKVTESVIAIIVAATVSHVVKSFFK